MAVLIEIDALNVGAGRRVTLRFAGSDDARITSLNDQVWWPGIITAPVLSMEGWDGNFTSAAILANASFSVDPGALRRNDAASPAYRWPGAAVRVYEGTAGAAWGSWVERFKGLIEDYSVDEAGRYAFQAKVDGEPFESPVLVNSYAGTGGAEGGDDLKAKPKPAVFGRARNIEPVLINSVDNVYQVHGYGAISAVSNVYERAADLVENGGTNVGNFASYAALVAATIPEGSFGTCLAQGMFRLGAPPAGLITCDVDGDTVSGFVRTTADVIARICAIAGVPGGRTDSANLSALNTAVPEPINLYLTQQVKVIDIVQALARPCNAQALISWTGVLRIVRFGAIPSSAMTLDADGRALPAVLAVQETKTSPPYWRIEMRGAQSWRVHTKDEIAEVPVMADWENITDNSGTKPDDNATVGAIIGDNLKDGTGAVVPATALLNSNLVLAPDGTLSVTIGGTTTVLGRVKLPDLGAASDTARRQLEDDLAKLSEAVAQLATGQQIVQNVFRDAGLYTDPASGTLKLFAIERRTDQTSQLSIDLNAALAEIGLKASVNYVNEAILAAELGGAEADLGPLLVRLTSAEASIDGLEASVELKADATTVSTLSGTVGAVQSTLDALAATVATKASQTVVDGQGARLTLAEATLAAFDGASISQSVTASRQVPAASDISGENNILALLGSVQANELVETGIARARTELNARVSSATDAIAALETTLGVQIGQVTAQIGEVQSAQVAGDAANAASLATFQASVNGSLSSVNTAISAQATSISAVASSVSSLTTTVNGNTSSITSFATSISGLQAKAGVTLDVNGYVTGWSLNNDGNSGSFIVRADRFAIVAAGGGGLEAPFEVVGGVTYIKNAVIGVGRIGSSNLEAGAIQKTYFRRTSGQFTIGPKVGDVSSGLTLFNVTITKTDASSIIEVIMYATFRSIDDLKFSTVVQIDGTIEQTGGANLVFDGGASAARVPLTMVAFKEGLSAGSHTIAVTVSNDNQDNLIIESLATLRITELRQAAI